MKFPHTEAGLREILDLIEPLTNEQGEKLTQFLRGMTFLPVLVRDDTLIISDNGDLYGTFADVKARAKLSPSTTKAQGK